MGRHWTPTGVLAGVGGQMKPTLAGTNLTVLDGAAWVDGHYCELLGAQVLTVTANGIAVVRFDPAANTAELVWRDAITTPSQSPTGVYEMLVASTTGSALKDRRSLVRAGQPQPNGVEMYNAGTTYLDRIQWVTYPWNLSMALRDVGGWAPASGGRLTVPASQPAGTIYTVRASGVWHPAPSAGMSHWVIHKNGQAPGGGELGVTSNMFVGNNCWWTLVGNMALNPGDFLELLTYQNTSAPLNVLAVRFSVTELAIT